MYCIYCGKAIPDGETCNCRSNSTTQSAASTENAAQSTPVYNSYYNPASTYQDGTTHRNVIDEVQTPIHTAVKKIMASPSGLVIAILLSVQFFLGLAAAVANNSFSMDILLILAVIAAWVTYAAGHNKNTTSTAGITINSGLLITGIVFASIAFFAVTLLVVLYGFFRRELWNINMPKNSYYWDLYYNFNVDNISVLVLIILEVVFLCLFLFILFYLTSLRHNVKQMRYAINGQKNVAKIKMFPIVVIFIIAASSILSNAFGLVSGNNFYTLAGNLKNTTSLYTYNYICMTRDIVSGAVYLFSGIYLLNIRREINKLI